MNPLRLWAYQAEKLLCLRFKRYLDAVDPELLEELQSQEVQTFWPDSEAQPCHDSIFVGSGCGREASYSLQVDIGRVDPCSVGCPSTEAISKRSLLTIIIH